MPKHRQWSVFLCAALAVLSVALAQQTTGVLRGTVSDPAGGVIKGAKVSAKLAATGLSRITQSDANGMYLFGGLVPGRYEVRVESPGFRTFVSQNVVILAGQTVTVDSVLSVGSVAETVEISAGSHSSAAPRKRIAAKGVRLKGRYNPDFNTEEYGHYEETGFQRPADHPLSTFAADADTASYSNMRRFLQEGRLPPPGSVRMEEYLNYFSYDYPEPQGPLPVAASTEVTECPWDAQHLLVRIGLRTKSISTSQLPPTNLTFLIDVSGSMSSSDKLPLLQQSARLLVEQLRPQDRVSIVAYAGAAGLMLPPTNGSEKERIQEAFDRLRAGGSTNGAGGIRLAYEQARRSFLPEGNNRVILATDGDFNVGVSSDSELVRLIESERDGGIFLSVLGFGTGNLKDSKMEKLADHGNGNYAYVDSLKEARKVLVQQMAGTLLTVAKDVKLQVEFNPAHVAAYRLIGYDNRVLRPEEFNDDKKDAGDLGAGHQMTALYEVVPVGVRTEVPGVDKLRYQRTAHTPTAGKSHELLLLKMRYKAPQGAKSELWTHAVLDQRTPFMQAAVDTRFAAAVAEFGLILRNSQYRGRASLDHVLAVSEEAKGTDAQGYRREFQELVRRAQQLYKAGQASE